MQNLHQRMVLALVRKFSEENMKIKGADYFRDIELPQKIGRYSPDIIAEDKDGSLVIGEAKNAGNIDNRKTREQFEDFLAAKGSNGKMAKLHIIVEEEAREELELLVKRWRLDLSRIFIWTY